MTLAPLMPIVVSRFVIIVNAFELEENITCVAVAGGGHPELFL